MLNHRGGEARGAGGGGGGGGGGVGGGDGRVCLKRNTGTTVLDRSVE